MVPNAALVAILAAATASSLDSGLGPVRPVRIAGGLNATKGEFPYAVSLQVHGKKGNLAHFCTGSLLDARTVLTAAHCVEPVVYTEMIYPEDMAVRVGSLVSNVSFLPSDASATDYTDVFQSSSSGGFLANVSSLFAHPYYNPYQVDWDVGIVKLSEPLPHSDGIEFAKLARRGSDPYEGAFAAAAGW